MATHWRHTRTTTDEDHFSVGVFGEELTKRPHHRYLVTRLQVEDVGRHQARRMTAARRRSRDTNVELEETFLFRIVRHGVGADDFLIALVGNVE